MKDLAQLLATAPDENLVISLSDGRERTHGDLLRRIAQYRAKLQALPSGAWGMYLEDVFEFAGALFALLADGREPVLLPHAQDGMLDELQGEVAGLVLTDDHADRDKALTPSAVTDSEPRDADAHIDISSFLHFYTSGSTGKGKRVKKALSQLVAEVQVLEQLWGARTQDATFFSTVSHQHIYGFLFRFLWPLLTGRPFWTESLLFPNDLQRHMETRGRAVLVSCPAHLQRMPDLFDMDVLREHCSTIFSSGGLLSPDCAQRMEKEWLEPPIEVFGSTETGGVAYRQQYAKANASPWTPMPGVALRVADENAPLEVTSPFVSLDEGTDTEWFAMGDKVQLHDDGMFTLRGRVDRMAKIEQKRVSLNAVEQRINDHPMIEKSAVIVVPDQSEYHRTFLGAVLVLSDEGATFCEERSKRALIQSLKQHLLRHFERVTLPRRWVVVEALPMNAQGKCTEEDLLKLFESDADATVRLPRIQDTDASDSQVTLQCVVPENLCYFDGHFDEQPIVAGVVQMHWAMHYAKEHFGIVPDVKETKAIKFHNVMFPFDTFTLRLNYDTAKHRVEFSLKSDDKIYSSGRLSLAS